MFLLYVYFLPDVGYEVSYQPPHIPQIKLLFLLFLVLRNVMCIILKTIYIFYHPCEDICFGLK